jgi:hypothetical protein
MRWVMLASASLTVAMLATSCSRSSATEASPQERPASCVKEGDRCEFAPGKIGLCTGTVKEGVPSLTCVSLH